MNDDLTFKNLSDGEDVCDKKYFAALALMCLFGCNIWCEKFVFFTSLFNEINPERAQEYITCLEKNLVHPMICKIHVVYDVSHDDAENKILKFLKSKDVEIHYINSRATFGDCFKLANSLYPNQKIIVSNADIYFNDTLNLLESYDLSNKFLALTRWNVERDGSLNLFWLHDREGNFRRSYEEYSQDVWIFSTPLRHFKDDIGIGSWRCDSLLAYQANASGLKVLNPCLTIQCCHLHFSKIRHYKDVLVEGKVMRVSWCTL